MIPYTREYDFEYGKIEELTPMIRRVTAKNPSGFSFHGTGTYIIGRGKVAVIDPGPLLPDHIETLKQGLAGEEVTHILITHTHSDHSPAAEPLKHFWQCPTYGYGPHAAGIERDRLSEGADMDYVPDIEIRHGEVIEGDNWTIECVFTPGHTSNHMCFALKEELVLFTGDHVMGWSTTVIGPPDGNMTQYLDSLHLLLTRDDQVYWPTHGPCIKDVKHFVQAYIDHRLDRENQILACLDQGTGYIKQMVPLMYQDTDKSLYGAAAMSVLAAIERLVNAGRVTSREGEITLNSHYQKSSAE
ncbi:MAG: MBL fold metallo-hydrolase [Pseudomonadales bacterium]|nr:MBL fold metallo-hydrolase [Pseudomonadales bacterium]